jgi:hypothetical protein
VEYNLVAKQTTFTERDELSERTQEIVSLLAQILYIETFALLFTQVDGLASRFGGKFEREFQVNLQPAA